MSNLRILSHNVLSTGILSSTNNIGGFPLSNLRRPEKGLTYRQATSSQTITIIWPQIQTISAIVLAYNNLSNTATYRLQAFNNEANLVGSSVHDSGTLVVPADISAESVISAPTHYQYSYGAGKVTAIYLPRNSTVRRIDLTITDTSNLNGFVEISSLVVGDTWSPQYNTSFNGLSIEWLDNSKHSRTTAGTLVTEISTVSKRLSFSLAYLTPSDRTDLVRMLRQQGMRTPMFISLFPADQDRQREQDYQIYGKLEQNPVLEHPMFTVYSTNISILEI